MLKLTVLATPNTDHLGYSFHYFLLIYSFCWKSFSLQCIVAPFSSFFSPLRVESVYL